MDADEPSVAATALIITVAPSDGLNRHGDRHPNL
jgi:hypothetical protein